VVDPALYPFAPHYLDLDPIQYHYVDEGEGEPLLLVHGNPTWSFYYRDVIKGMSPHMRVIAPDHVGCGRSDKPQHYPYRLAQHIANLEELVLRLDLRDVTLGVHDWGGPIGLGVAVRHPERFRRLVIFNTSGFRSTLMPPLLSLARIPLFGDLMIRGCNLFALAATYIAIGHQERMRPEVRAGYLAPYDSWANRIATLRFVQDIPLKPSDPSYATLAEVEAGLPLLADRPVMLIWGMRDWVFTPAFLDGFLKFFPAARVHRLDDAAHLVVEDAHERILPWLREFLSGVRV